MLVDAKQRIQTLAAVRSHPAMAAVNLENVKAKKIKPLFVPSVSIIMCDDDVCRVNKSMTIVNFKKKSFSAETGSGKIFFTKVYRK